VYGNATPAAAPTTSTYRHFDNTARRVLIRQNYDPICGGHSTRQMCTFWWCDGNSYTYDIKDKLATLLWSSAARVYSVQHFCSS
jgi:hypothetical protein